MNNVNETRTSFVDAIGRLREWFLRNDLEPPVAVVIPRGHTTDAMRHIVATETGGCAPPVQLPVCGIMITTDNGDSWPPSARFKRGDHVHIKPRDNDRPRFPGYVVGWYEPRNGRHRGYVVEHERDGIIHVYPESALAPGMGEF